MNPLAKVSFVLLTLVGFPVSDLLAGAAPVGTPAAWQAPDATAPREAAGPGAGQPAIPSPPASSAPSLSSPWRDALLAGYCLMIVVASLFGGWLPTRFVLSHTRMQTVISFVGGLMLGIALFHLLPDSVRDLPGVNSATGWMMLGIVSMFILIRTFHFHHHGPLEISTAHEVACELHADSPAVASVAHGHEHSHEHSHEHGESCAHAPEVEHGQPHCHHAHQLSWVGIATGLSVHTMIDGIALAASVEAQSGHGGWLPVFGLGTFLAVLLHKPLDAVSITSLMAAAGWSAQARHLVNAGFSLMCPAGAVLFMAGIRGIPGWQSYAVGAALAFSAGVFLCISLSDLLPEMEFHEHNRLRLSTALGAGILLAFVLTLLESSHQH